MAVDVPAQMPCRAAERVRILASVNIKWYELARRCDRRPLNPYPRRDKPDVKYIPDKGPTCPTSFACCPTAKYEKRPSAVAVRPRIECNDHKSCQPECVPCNASLRDLCDGFPQWFTDFVGELESTRQPENKLCGRRAKEQQCRKFR